MNKSTFNKKNLKNDLLSGLIVALVSIPISMGYAQIAGIPPVYGLYGSLLPILIFSLFTTSPQFIVGVDAMPAAMVGSSLVGLGIVPFSEENILIVPALSFFVALWLLVFRFIKAGRLVKYISNAVMGGFISGVGATMILMQVPKLFSGHGGTGEFIVLIENIVVECKNCFNLFSLLLGLGTVFIILFSKKVFPKLPMSIFMLAIGMLLTSFFHVEKYGVLLLSKVDGGLPRLKIPSFAALGFNLPGFIFLTLTVSLVIMTQSLLCENSYGQKYEYTIDNNRELLSFSLMNFAGSLSGSCPINGSVSRTGLADQFGNKSQITSITAFICMFFVLLFCTKFFIYLPVPILTGIVTSALIGIIDYKQAFMLWKRDKFEFSVFMVAFFGVLFLGTLYGVMVGVMLSFLQVVRKAVLPPRSFLGKIPGQHGYYNMARNTNSLPICNTLIYRFGGNLFFANAETFEKDIFKALKNDTKFVIVDASAIGDIDITGAEKLKHICEKLEKRNICFYLTEHEGHINDLLRKYACESLIEKGHVRRTMSLALRDCGFTKPYVLEGSENLEELSYAESDEKLAEFEWAFGIDAQEWMEKLSEELFVSLSNVQNPTELESLNIEKMEEKLEWGKIGLFDEDELLEKLEIKLEEFFDKGLMNKNIFNEIESKIFQRKTVLEEKIKLLNPKASDLLESRRKLVEEHLSKTNPKEFTKLKELHGLLKNSKKDS